MYPEDDFVLNLTGTGITAPKIIIEQPTGTNLVPDSTSVNFGSVNPSSQITRTFTIRNQGTASLTGIATSFSGTNAADFTVTTAPPATLAAGASSTFVVRFSPATTGPRSAAIRIASNDVGSNPFIINLTGTGAGEPRMTVTYINIVDVPNGADMIMALNNFKLGSSINRSYTIKNLGNLPLGGLSMGFEGVNAGDLSTVTAPPATLAPGASAVVTFRFMPTGTGNRAFTLRINSSDPNNGIFRIHHTAEVFGVPEIEVALAGSSSVYVSRSATTAFGAMHTGGTVTRDFVIRSIGSAALEGVAVTFTGGAATDYAVVTQPASTIPFSGGTNSRTFSVRFSPKAAGARNTTMRISSNDEDENPFEIALTATGQLAPDIALLGGSGGEDIAHGGTVPGFAGTAVNSLSNLHLRLRNSGATALTGLRATLSGANAGEFSIGNDFSGMSIAAGQEVSFYITFQPKAAGTRTASLSIASNDPDENPFVVQLRAEAINAPDIDASVTLGDTPFEGYDLGEAFVGKDAPFALVRIRNHGNMPLQNLSISLAGTHPGDFEVDASSLPPAVQPGSSEVFRVFFKPSATGERKADILIRSNDPDENPHVISLTGTGANGPRLVLQEKRDLAGRIWSYENQDTLYFGPEQSFGRVRLIHGGYTKRLTVKNVGNQNLSVLSFSMAGTHPTEFTVSGWVPGSVLKSGEEASFSVVALPSNSGKRTGTLGISSNDPKYQPFMLRLEAVGVSEKNIVINGDFSVADGASGEGWAGSFSRQNSPTLTGGGYYFFAGAVASKMIHQTYTLTPQERASCRIPASASDAVLRYFFSADLFGYTNQGDYSTVRMNFIHSNESLNTSITLDGRTGRPASWPSTLVAGNAPNYKWTSGAVPPGTVAITTELRAYRTVGTDCDGFADNIRVELGRSGTDATRGLEDWAAAAALSMENSQPHSQPQSDGVSNLLKYAFNIDPSRAGVSVMQPSGTAGLPAIRTIGSGNECYLEFEFMRRKADGLKYTPMISTNLGANSFTPTNQYVFIREVDALWERITVLHPYNPAETPRLFGRVMVELSH